MNIVYTFPFCVIAFDNQIRTVKGKIKVSDGKNTSSHSFSVVTTTWDEQTPADFLLLEDIGVPIFKDTVDLSFSASLEDSTVLIQYPSVQWDNVPLHVNVLRQEYQNQVNTQGWINVPITSDHPSKVKVELGIKSKPMLTKADVQFEYQLKYVKPLNTKPKLTHETAIEYYLGKDHVKNLFFKEEIAAALSIPPRILDKKTKLKPGENLINDILYTINDLGYRSKNQFTKQNLADQSLILCLGDSDVFGINVSFDDIWTTKLQAQIDQSLLVMNMGVQGISNDGLTRLGVSAINCLGSQIQAVCVMYAPPSLREFVSKKYQAGVHTRENYNLPYQDWWDHIDWQSNNYNFYKNKLMLASTCAKFDIAYHDLFLNKNDSKVPLDYIAFGKYTSIGPCTHTAIANYFYKKINNKPSLFQQMQL
jgi:hypothetical protein